MENIVKSIKEFKAIKEEEESSLNSELNIAEEILDDLVEKVGSEEDVENAAKEAYEDLKSAYESESIEMMEEGVPENLAMSALVLKLVEKGLLDPKSADSFIGDNVED